MQIMVQHCAVEDDVALGRRHGSLLSDRNQWWIIKALDRGSPRSVAWVIGDLDIQSIMYIQTWRPYASRKMG